MPPDNRAELPPPAPSFGELPLFPLDVVLFPGMKMSLHIFEPRYIALVERCLDESRDFGIVLVRGDAQPAKNARRVKTHRVGCVARITHVERLDKGRFNIEIEGTERFRLVEQHEVEPYRTGIVETIGDRALSSAEQEVAQGLCQQVQQLLEDFLTRQLAALGQRVVEFELPRDPQVLSLIAACILPLDNPDKQTLLEATDTARRLGIERDLLTQAIEKMRRGTDRSAGDTFAATGADRARRTFEQIHADRYRDYVCGN